MWETILTLKSPSGEWNEVFISNCKTATGAITQCLAIVKARENLTFIEVVGLSCQFKTWVPGRVIDDPSAPSRSLQRT